MENEDFLCLCRAVLTMNVADKIPDKVVILMSWFRSQGQQCIRDHEFVSGHLPLLKP